MIKHLEKERRFVYLNEKEEVVGECAYVETESSIDIIATMVKEEYRGRGIAKALVGTVMEYASQKGKDISSSCSYGKNAIKK